MRYTGYMRVLGIDPGIGRLGWGVIEVQSGNLKVQSYDCFETPSIMEVPKRLELIYAHMLSIIDEYKPDALGIEDLFFSNNAKTAFVVGQARGVVLLAAAQKNLSIGVYTPLQVKSAVTGYGKAEKRQVGEMVKILLKLKSVPKPDDTADALAIAITHAFSVKMKGK